MNIHDLKAALRYAFAVERHTEPVLGRPLEQIADSVVERGLEAPVTMLLETLRPVSFLASQALVALQPFAELLGQGTACRDIAMSLQDRRTPGRLIERIEERRCQRTTSDRR